jgi:hypothetical protein
MLCSDVLRIDRFPAMSASDANTDHLLLLTLEQENVTCHSRWVKSVHVEQDCVYSFVWHIT